LPLLIEKIPFLLLSAGSCVVTVHAQRGAMVWMARVPFLDRMGNALVSCWRYLGKLLWPANLSCLYPLSDWPALTVLLAGAALLAVSALAIVLWRRSPCFAAGWFWFLGTLVPVIGLVAVGEQSIADRYTYIPCIGVFFAFAWGVRDLTRSWRWHTAVLRVAATGIVLACIPVTRQNLGCWKDTETLFRHALQTTGKNYRACVNLGGELFHQGRIDDAMGCFLKAVEFKPDSAEAHSDLGVALHAMRRSAEAILEQKEALRLKPDFAEAHFNLGNLLEEAGQLEESIREYQRAAALKPEPLFHRNLGAALARCGRVDEAMTAFEEALALDPHDATARVGLGEAFRRKGRVEEAAAQFKEALRIDPQNMSARTNLDLMPAKARQD
jgi:Flp pilus assembly protein TadD